MKRKRKKRRTRSPTEQAGDRAQGGLTGLVSASSIHTKHQSVNTPRMLRADATTGGAQMLTPDGWLECPPLSPDVQPFPTAQFMKREPDYSWIYAHRIYSIEVNGKTALFCRLPKVKGSYYGLFALLHQERVFDMSIMDSKEWWDLALQLESKGAHRRDDLHVRFCKAEVEKWIAHKNDGDLENDHE